MGTGPAMQQDVAAQQARFSTGSNIEIVSDRAGLNHLRQEWDSLRPPANAAPWLTSLWADCCSSAFGDTEALHIIALRRHGALVAVAPLAIKRSSQLLRPLRLDFLGAEDLREPNGLIYADGDALSEIADSIAAERTLPVRLSRLPANPAVIAALAQAFRRRAWLVKLMHMSYPYVELNSDARCIKKSLQEDLRRARRKTERCGQLAWEMAALNPATINGRLQEAFEIEASGWKGANKTAIRCNAARSRFFTLLAEACARERTLRLAFLRVGERYVASQFAIESDNQYWLLNVAYRDDARQFSPGNLLLEETIHDAEKRELSRYNFLGKEEAWTKRWTSGTQDCLVFAAYRRNLLGVRAALSDALYLLQRRHRNRVVQALKSSGKGAHLKPG